MTTQGNDIDFDELLAESVKQATDKKAAQSAESKLRRGGNSKKEEEELREKVREYDNVYNWTPTTLVAHFMACTCINCGEETLYPSGLLVRWDHKTQVGSVRYERPRPGQILTHLLKDTMYTSRTSEYCNYCVEDLSFPAEMTEL